MSSLRSPSHRSLPSSASAEAVGSLRYLESDDELEGQGDDDDNDQDESRESNSHLHDHAEAVEGGGDLEQGTRVPDDSEEPLLRRKKGSESAKWVQQGDNDSKPPLWPRFVFMLCFLAALAVALAYIIPSVSSAHDDTRDNVIVKKRQFPQRRNPSYLVQARHGAVAAEEERCSTVGIDILQKNGTATDAALAAALCVGTINMFSSGIGGGGFAIVRNHDDLGGGVFGIDFRETAPAGASKDMYGKDKTQALIGPKSIGVPGELAGMWMAWKVTGGGNQTLRELGRGVDWSVLFEPSVRLSRQGFAVGAELALRFQRFGSFILDSPVWWPEFTAYTPQGPRLLRQGEMMWRMAYSRTLEAIAIEGPEAFYRGAIARSMTSYIKKNGGLVGMEDLAGYQAERRETVTTTYFGRKVHVLPPPTSGIVLLQMLNVAEEYGEAWKSSRESALNTHRLIEILKFAFASRTEIGDQGYIHNAKAIDEITTRQKAKDILGNITDDTTHPLHYYNPHFAVKEDHGTTHVSVIDQWGGACGFTTTINLIFGSQVLDPDTGVIFNDEMADFAIPGRESAFSLKPSPYNFIQPGKRPLSSTSPTIIESQDGHIWLNIGGSGGSRIFGAIAQTLFNVDRGMDLAEAIEEARLHDQLMPRYTDFELPYSDKVLAELKVKGHNISTFDINEARAEIQAVMREPVDAESWLWAASDSRKTGVASGY